MPDQIGQVILNLLINALQAIEATGRTEGGRIEVDARHEGTWVAISVSDNGRGIDPETSRTLFDPFFTTKPVGEGTGLGLAICHGIITGHGGRIEVESRVGEGTRFRVLLPQHPNPGPLPRRIPESLFSYRMTSREGHDRIQRSGDRRECTPIAMARVGTATARAAGTRRPGDPAGLHPRRSVPAEIHASSLRRDTGDHGETQALPADRR